MMRSKSSLASWKEIFPSATSQLSRLSCVLMSKLMACLRMRSMWSCVFPLSLSMTQRCTCDVMMEMSTSSPSALAMRLTFFSVRMQVAPQPSSQAA